MKHQLTKEKLVHMVGGYINKDIGKMNKGSDKGAESWLPLFIFPNYWGCSSIGRAIGLQPIGRRFDSYQLHNTNVTVCNNLK